MVLRYLLLSIPLRHYKIICWVVMLQYHFSSIYLQECCEIIGKRLNKILTCAMGFCLASEVFVHRFHPVVYMQLFVYMVNVFTHCFRADKKVIGYFLVQQSF